MAIPSVSYTFVNGTVADGTQVSQNFSDIIASLTDGSKSLNIDALTCGGTATFNGNTAIGNAASDTHVVTGRLSGNGSVPAGAIMAFAMATPPTGWLACDGTAVSRSTYADLFTAIGTTWDNCRNQSTGSNYSSPAGTEFRLPDLRGTFLRSTGTSSGYDATTLAATQDDETALNGISVSGGAPSLTGTTSFSATNHVHGTGSLSADITFASDYVYANIVSGGDFTPSKRIPCAGNAQDNTTGMTTSTNIQGNTDTSATTASVGISSDPATIATTDSETRPVNVGVSYFIKA